MAKQDVLVCIYPPGASLTAQPSYTIRKQITNVNSYNINFNIGLYTNFYMNFAEVFKRVNDLYRDFQGRSFRIWCLNKPYIVLSNPNDINVSK